ncbi:MAG: nucleotidyltransferase family protein [Deltaproteobacteria bacterium]|nr:nucleotidyltransferase family protein [Deltaproteobacteria bacterium]
MTQHQDKFTALILAADRGPDDPVAKAAGVPCKSLAPIGGTPMVFRVLSALDASLEVEKRILCGPPKQIVNRESDLQKLIGTGRVNWFENLQTPSSTAYHVLQKLPENIPVLLTTADHALLNPQMVDYFCNTARATKCDVVVGVARHEDVMKAHPETRRTATRLQDDAYCGCNLFAFMTPDARVAADFWRQVESERKKPLRMIQKLGWVPVLRYLLGILSLDDALKSISQRLGFKAGAVIMPFADAAVDVDSVSDWELVKKIVNEKQT